MLAFDIFNFWAQGDAVSHSVLVLLLLAGPIYLYNFFVFKSATPTLKDKTK